MPRWDLPGWDWADGDYTWLSSQSGVYHDGVYIYFIHGGLIKHEVHVPEGSYAPDEFATFVAQQTAGLDHVRINYMSGGGDDPASLWVTGVRPPNESDLVRLQNARDTQERKDQSEIKRMRRKH